ncbi:MAG: hypothetical protein ACLU2J_02965 [Clostridia bacterium]
MENLLKENKNYSEIKTIQDLSGNDRCVIAKVAKFKNIKLQDYCFMIFVIKIQCYYLLSK